MDYRRICRVLLAVTLAVCAAPLIARAPGAVVIGTIVDAATSRGIAGAVVHIQGPGTSQTRVTDPKGRFYFLSLPAGAFEIVASKSGYYEGAYGRLRAGGDGLPLELVANQWISDVSIPLFKPAVIAGFVTDESNEPLIGVRVQALRREQVLGHWRFTAVFSDVTDDQGQYRISGLRPGGYVVVVPSVQVTLPTEAADAADARAVDAAPVAGPSNLGLLLMINGGFERAAGRIYDDDRRYVLATGDSATPPPRDGTRFAYPNEYYPGVELPGIAMPMLVSAGERREGVNLQLRPVPASRVSGMVIGPDGPVGNQLLRLMHDDQEDTGLGSDVANTITTVDGRFQFLDVPVGRYLLRARDAATTVAALPPGAAASLGSALNDEGLLRPVATSLRALWGDLPVLVSGADVVGVSLMMQPSLALSGRVALESSNARASAIDLSDARISLDAVDGSRSGVLPVMPTPGGTFTIGGLASGSYLVRVSSLPAGWTLKSAIAAGRDVSDVPLEIYGGVDPPSVSVTLTDQGTSVSGTIHDTRGLISTTATVLVFPIGYRSLLDNGADPRRFRAVRASPYGIYKTYGLPAGDYFFVAVDESTTENWQEVRVLERVAAAATRVSIRALDRRVLDLRITRLVR